MIILHTLVALMASFMLFIIYIYSGSWIHNRIDYSTTTSSKTKHPTSSSLIPPNPEVAQPPSASVLHIYEQAAVCSDSSICSDIGRDILQRNGSVVDAAIATLLCNGLIAMQSMGLGGGLLMNVYIHSEQRAYSILSRETAPHGAKANMFAQFPNMSAIFGNSLAIAVPGEVMGYALAYERFGKLPWADLVQPTVALCEHGYQLTKHQRDSLHTNREMCIKDRHLRKMFFNETLGDFHRVGTHIHPVKELCQTYEYLAADGPRSFYTGKLAENILADLHDMASPIDALDLREYKAQLKLSHKVSLGDEHIMHLIPTPGSGIILGFIMRILHQFKQDFMRAKQLNALGMHRIVEAMKFGFVKRWLLDAEMEQELLHNITSTDYAVKIANIINDQIAFNDHEHYGANSKLITRSDHGTAHISILAPNGDAVAVTSSIHYYFGTGRTGTRTGIIFNNVMTDFATDGFENYFDLPLVKNKNRIKGAQSPMSSMAPTIVSNRNGDVRLVIGAAGGTRIISLLTQLLVRILWFKENIKEAIDAARFHHQLSPNMLQYDYGLVQSLVEAMESKGHTTERHRHRGSAVCGVEQLGKMIFANADYHKDGGVAGY